MNDLDLYNACMNFCRAYGKLVTHRSQLDKARLVYDGEDIEILKRRVEMEEKWFRSEYTHLCDVVSRLGELQND